MRFTLLLPGLCLFAAACAASSERSLPPELILLHGRVFTADSANPWVEAVAITGQRITAVGSSAEIAALAGPDTRQLDLDGRVVIPGINDAHMHSGTTVRSVTIPTAGVNTQSRDLLDSLRAVVHRTEPGLWLYGSIGPDVLADRGVTRALLDDIAPRHPIWLLAFGGHGMLLNSAAMRELEIGDTEPDPVGGWHERIPGSARVGGALHGYANFGARARTTTGVPDSVAVAGLARFAATAVRFGITSVQDMPVAGVEAAARQLRAADVPIRWRLIHFPMSTASGRRAPDAVSSPVDSAGLITVSGTKWVMEGTPLERGSLMRTAYEDRPDWHGVGFFPDDTLRAIVAEALHGAQPMLLHVTGDSLLSTLFHAMRAAADDTVWQRLRLRIEHGDLLMPDQVTMARELGVVIVQNPSHFTFPELMQGRFGERTASMQPMRALLEAGVPLALGSDGPLNPFLNIMFATMHPTNPREALTREQAVTAYTRGSAFAEFTEHEKGMLRPGYLADLAVLSQDIFAVPPDALPATTSVLTLVGGRIVHDALRTDP